MEQLPKIKTILSCAGIPIFGCCPFEPLRPQILECRAKERLPADAKSIFVALFPYAMEEAAYQGGNLSRYAAVGDYHEIVPAIPQTSCIGSRAGISRRSIRAVYR